MGLTAARGSFRGWVLDPAHLLMSELALNVVTHQSMANPSFIVFSSMRIVVLRHSSSQCIHLVQSTWKYLMANPPKRKRKKLLGVQSGPIPQKVKAQQLPLSCRDGAGINYHILTITQQTTGSLHFHPSPRDEYTSDQGNRGAVSLP